MPTATQELRLRFLTLDPTDADTDTFELSFSSETPVARQYGDEVLSHARCIHMYIHIYIY